MPPDPGTDGVLQPAVRAATRSRSVGYAVRRAHAFGSAGPRALIPVAPVTRTGAARSGLRRTAGG